MIILDYAKLIIRLIKYKLTQSVYDSDYLPQTDGTGNFVSAKTAVAMIKDQSTVFAAGIAAHARCSIFYWALRDHYLERKKPAGLTWITTAAHGGRGAAPGTIEDIAIPGMMSEYICSHVETAKAQLALADQGELTIQTIPYGEIVFLLERQAAGENTYLSTTGKGTFLDPDMGGSSLVAGTTKKTLIKSKDGQLEYTMPKVDVALLVAPYSDKEGNIYFKNAACITDHYESAMAAYKNNGKVIVAVADIIEKCEESISIPAKYVHAIVVNPMNEQTGGIRQRQYLKVFTEGAKENIGRQMAHLKVINRLSGAAYKRSGVDNALSRLAAAVFTGVAEKNDLVNFGVGLPEEVSRVLHESGIHGNYKFSTEAGGYGGVPAPGIFFGGALNPEKLKSSAWMFNHYKSNLSVAVFGFLQVDSAGNVNVSKRGTLMKDYVGPGGLMNIANSAKSIIFIGHWMQRARYSTKDGKIRIKKTGKPKFVDRVDEVTFSGHQALLAGKTVFFATTVGLFKLTDKGLELKAVMPGIDIQNDIVATTDAALVVADESMVVQLPVNFVTGKGFHADSSGLN